MHISIDDTVLFHDGRTAASSSSISEPGPILTQVPTWPLTRPLLSLLSPVSNFLPHIQFRDSHSLLWISQLSWHGFSSRYNEDRRGLNIFQVLENKMAHMLKMRMCVYVCDNEMVHIVKVRMCGCVCECEMAHMVKVVILLIVSSSKHTHSHT